MKHYGHEDRQRKTMELDFWLTIGHSATPYGKRPSVKVTAGYPALARNERAINLKMSLPMALFETPSLAATIKVEQPTQAIEINADAVAEAVRSVVGMDVVIEVKEPTNEDHE